MSNFTEEYQLVSMATGDSSNGTCSMYDSGIIDFCCNMTFLEIRRSMNVNQMGEAMALYKYLCPPLIFSSSISVLINCTLFIVGHKYTRNKSPVLLLSLNLACTDMLASLTMGISLIMSAYLPTVFGIKFDTCSMLIFEIVRISSFIASVLHLLSLAGLHFRGIVNPLHSRTVSCFGLASVTKSIHLISLCCWMLPIALFTAYFLYVPCQGFQSAHCDITFLLAARFRILVFVCFATPLLLMAVLYIRIFALMKEHAVTRASLAANNDHLLAQNNNQHTTMSTVTIVSLKWYHKFFLCARSSQPSPSPPVTRIDPPTNDAGSNSSSRATTVANGSPTTSSSTSNFKALATTLIILGTYLVCWGPAVTFQILTCIDGCPFPILQMEPKTLVLVSFVMNMCVCLKSLVDPFIYTLRMKEVRLAFAKMLSGGRHQRSSRDRMYNRTVSSTSTNMIARPTRQRNGSTTINAIT